MVRRSSRHRAFCQRLTAARVEGVYLVIAFECVDILRRRDRRQIHSMYLHISAIAMFIAITMVRTILLTVAGLLTFGRRSIS